MVVSSPQPTLSARQMRRLSDEGTRQRYNLMDLARTMDDVILLGRGDPDLATPDHIVEAAKAAIDRGVDIPSDPAGPPGVASRHRGETVAGERRRGRPGARRGGHHRWAGRALSPDPGDPLPGRRDPGA